MISPSFSLPMVPTVGGWFSHGPVDGFLMDQYIGLHTTNTPRIDVEMVAPAKKMIHYDVL